MDLQLHSSTGRVWHIHGASAGAEGVALLEGADGLWEAPIKSVWMQGAFQEGATYVGFRTEPLDVILPIGIRGETYAEWAHADSLFRNDLGDPDSEFSLVAISESGQRELKLRLTDTPVNVRTTDPGEDHYTRLVVQARAGWPRWVGEAEASGFTSTNGNSSGFVTVTNPTDTWLYPLWVCDAPGKWSLPDFSWRDDQWHDRVITTPTLGSGEALTIDTYPANESYVSANGSNIAGRFGGVEFLFPIPPHTPPTQVPVKVSGGQAGASVMVRMTRNWRRPRGGDSS
ncbi:minor tail protein Gp27 [[Brevibacterium] flavum]|uniref:Minor tail protein Gp27 n=1 Tax=[Brevibacterium] flavum TaxID=92706 RepID=A0A0F6SRD8_9CORY|nr:MULTISPECIES: hypothetical protein [Corynebacterium]AKF27784.1 minor tail protein Gp27 [[Brevibacterium] flavum]ANE08611.1 phage tail protein [Corynebacterium glutamicum]AST21025.1 phage tail protein [Corynebacterium glutamicum ATCC 14067]KEI23534.1 minor tail protein Gp27 [Corynebacterium glutamicum ATCC 14067]KIH73282.1 minor tail protein Gp27 [Corynebacterium glutamicum]